MISFRGPAKRIEDIDLPRIGAEIGVGEDEIHALIDVESSGSGFDAQGRPKALYEPHVAYRNSSGDVRSRLVAAGLAYPGWGEQKYLSDSYPRIMRACEIDETVALKATSWGLPQILGENHKAAGYASPQAMLADFLLDEDNHLEAMIRFVKAKGIDKALRSIKSKADRGEPITNADWIPVASPYNGSQFAKHNYHGRLNTSYAKWRKIKDTPFTLNDIRASAAKESEAAISPKAAAPAPTSGNVAGTTAVIVAAGGGAVIANESAKKGADTGQIAIVVGLSLVIAIAAFFIIRRLFKRD